MNFRTPFVTFAALALTAGAAHATPFLGTVTFTDSTPGNSLNLTATSQQISFNQTAGGVFSMPTLLTIKSTDTSGNGVNTTTDAITVTFDFTQPSVGTGSTSGTGAETVFSLNGTVYARTGSIVWNNPNTIIFSDGAILSVSLVDATLGGNGATLSANVGATFADIKDPTSVPEPMSLALLGTGALGMASAVRRHRSN
jgi:PEP-CTERM motif